MASGYNRRIREVLYRGRELVLTEPRGRVSLAYRELTEVSREVFLRPKSLIILDLSYNSIKDFRFLQILTNLTTLVLDHNDVTSHTSFPPLPKLELLWVNDNKISNLSIFIGNVATNFPNLRVLSMMKNDAAPSYFNGGSKQEYLDYRYYIISQLTALYALDDSIITNEERTTASRLYGLRRRSFSTLTTLKSTKQTKRQSETTPLLEASL